MTEVQIDEHGVALVVNSSAVAIPEIVDRLAADGQRKVADALTQWVRRTQGPSTIRRKGRFGGILDRDKFLTPTNYFDAVRVARDAMRDDVVGGAADGTEALALEHVAIECEDLYEQDVWNQIAGDLDLDGQLRKHWRGLFSDSAAVAALWWGQRSYKPRIPAKGGNAARKEFNLQVPLGVSFLDATKIVPVGSLMFGQELLAYQAEPLEAFMFDQILARRDGTTPVQIRMPPTVGPRRRQPGRTGNALQVMPLHLDEGMLNDPVVERLIVGKYIPDLFETQQLDDDGITDVNHLYLLDPTSVFRHTATRMDYERFPDVRLASTFELLDLKAQLRQMDRVHLVGGAHMIILITKGTDKIPAQPEEISALRMNAQTIASVPLIVGDHRLSVEIITPKLDVTLNREKWDTLDVRIFARSWGTFIPTGDDLGDPTKIARVIGRNLESRRKMMRRFWEANLFQAIRNRNPDVMKSRAKLTFQPAQIAIAFDAAWASFLLDLREIGDIAHGTTLAQFGFSIVDEARKVEREAQYKQLFQENAPFNPFGQQPGGGAGDDDEDPAMPTNVARRRGGRRGGGERSGGGAAPGTGQGQAPTGRSRSGGGRRARTQDTTEGDADE